MVFGVDCDDLLVVVVVYWIVGWKIFLFDVVVDIVGVFMYCDVDGLVCWCYYYLFVVVCGDVVNDNRKLCCWFDYSSDVLSM